MIENPAVFVINDQNCCAIAQLIIGDDLIVNRGDKKFPGLHIVIRMLIRGRQRPAARSRMIFVIRLDETIVRQITAVAIVQKLLISPEDLWLFAQKVNHFHRRARDIEVVQLRRLSCREHTVVDALVWSFYLERVHPNTSERGSIVGERPIADCWARDRRKPSIEDRETARKGRQDRKIVGFEIVHDLPRMIDIGLLVVVACHKSPHRWDVRRSIRAQVELLVHRREMMIRIGIELPLKISLRLHPGRFICLIQIAFIAREAIDSWIELLQPSQHVIEGAVLHHDYDNMLEFI